MPVRRSSNGGWQRVTSSQLQEEERVGGRLNEINATVVPSAPLVVADATKNFTETELINNDTVTTQNTNDECGGSRRFDRDNTHHQQQQHPNWLNEGIRRVRNDQVVYKMHCLTGMAAIGGFLFGYDTGT
jgi:hypothetical protein